MLDGIGFGARMKAEVKRNEYQARQAIGTRMCPIHERIEPIHAGDEDNDVPALSVGPSVGTITQLTEVHDMPAIKPDGDAIRVPDVERKSLHGAIDDTFENEARRSAASVGEAVKRYGEAALVAAGFEVRHTERQPGSADAKLADVIRTFGSGATRDTDVGKFDYEAFLSPAALEAYARYMNACRSTASGLRDGDNWQKGIPFVAYIKSKWRHDFDVWKRHRGLPTRDHQIINLCAVLFNTFGYLHETLKAMAPEEIEAAFKHFEAHRAAEIAAKAKTNG